MATSSASVRYFDLVREMKDAVRRVEDITEALWGTRVSRSTVSELNQKIYGRWNLAQPADRRQPPVCISTWLFLDFIRMPAPRPE
jgi:hypothetical protein